VVLRGGGLTVSSTSAPSLNGTYLCDGVRWDAITAQANAILLSGATPSFADGSQSLSWPDKSGALHSFTPAQFHELIVALSNFVAQCYLYGEGATQTAPAAIATIA